MRSIEYSPDTVNSLFLLLLLSLIERIDNSRAPKHAAMKMLKMAKSSNWNVIHFANAEPFFPLSRYWRYILMVRLTTTTSRFSWQKIREFDFKCYTPELIRCTSMKSRSGSAVSLHYILLLIYLSRGKALFCIIRFYPIWYAIVDLIEENEWNVRAGERENVQRLAFFRRRTAFQQFECSGFFTLSLLLVLAFFHRHIAYVLPFIRSFVRFFNVPIENTSTSSVFH